MDEKEKELREEAALLEASFKFWEKQIDELFHQIDEIEKQMEANNPYSTELEKQRDILTQKLMSLISKGDVEDRAISKLQEKIDVELYKQGTKKENKDEKMLFLESLGIAAKKP